MNGSISMNLDELYTRMTVSFQPSLSFDELIINGHEVMGIAFSPDGLHLAAGVRDGTARIYLLRLEDLIGLAKQRVTRSLTTEECQQYLHVATCPVQ